MGFDAATVRAALLGSGGSAEGAVEKVVEKILAFEAKPRYLVLCADKASARYGKSRALIEALAKTDDGFAEGDMVLVGINLIWELTRDPGGPRYHQTHVVQNIPDGEVRISSDLWAASRTPPTEGGEALLGKLAELAPYTAIINEYCPYLPGSGPENTWLPQLLQKLVPLVPSRRLLVPSASKGVVRVPPGFDFQKIGAPVDYKNPIPRRPAARAQLLQSGPQVPGTAALPLGGSG